MSIASRYRFVSLAVMILSTIVLARHASAQVDQNLVLEPWVGDDFYNSFDKPLLETRGKVNDTGNAATVLWYDSFGKLRFNKQDPDSIDVGYHWISMDFYTHDPRLTGHLDEMAGAAGFHLGEIAGGNVSVVAGVGFSGNQLFADSRGVFGIAHVMYDHKLSNGDSLIGEIDYDRSGAFMPDIPLPGIEYWHHDTTFDWEIGFPQAHVSYTPAPWLKATVSYSVPFTADFLAEFPIWKVGKTAISPYINYDNYYHGFQQEYQKDNRLFFQMQRVEAGVRFVHGTLIDAAIGGGYGFDQHFARGWDVRGLSGVASLADRPYIVLTLRGTF